MAQSRIPVPVVLPLHQILRLQPHAPSLGNGRAYNSRVLSPSQESNPTRSSTGANGAPQLSPVSGVRTARISGPISRELQECLSDPERTLPLLRNDLSSVLISPQALPQGPPIQDPTRAQLEYQARHPGVPSGAPIDPRSTNRLSEEALPNNTSSAPGQLSRPDEVTQHLESLDGQVEAHNLDRLSRMTTGTGIPHSATYLENVHVQDDRNADWFPPENIRPVPQNLRYGGYPGQPAPPSRNTPLGSGRLQNTNKPGALQSADVQDFRIDG